MTQLFSVYIYPIFMIKEICVTDGQTQHDPHPGGFYMMVNIAKRIKARTEGISNTKKSKEGEINSILGGKMKTSIMMY